MFEAKRLVFMYCVSPVHMGAGTAIGPIDNPIQRERHTDYPVFAGSGLKGAIRHHLKQRWGDNGLVARIFGPEAGASSEHAGAISFTDAQLVAFPVRSLDRAFVYATSPVALGRLKRLALLAGLEPEWEVPSIEQGHCRMAKPDSPGNTSSKLVLEAFECSILPNGGLAAISSWIADHALPGGQPYQFFREKLKTDLVLLADEEFSYFVRNATVVEPHVRIDDETGTAESGGLFYTENLPPESLLVALAMASVERYKKDKPNGWMDAETVMEQVAKGDNDRLGLTEQLLQIGGDSTTGRGLVVVRFPETNNEVGHDRHA